MKQNANQIISWLKGPRFIANDEALACFLPVEIARPDTHKAKRCVVAEGSIEVELVGGHRIIVNGPYDTEALGRLILNLSVDTGSGEHEGLTGLVLRRLATKLVSVRFTAVRPRTSSIVV